MNKPTLGLMLALALSLSCSAIPEEKTSGRCTLSCDNAKVAGAEFIVAPLGPAAIALHCEADFSKSTAAATPTPLQARFLVYEQVPAFGSAQAPAATAAAAGGAAAGGADPSAATTTTSTPLLSRLPKAGIGFEPDIKGLVAVENTAKEFMNGDKVSSAKYAGVVTPKAEWCSDSCGVITFEFWPKCIAGKDNSITVGTAVEGVSAMSPLVLTLSNP